MARTGAPLKRLTDVVLALALAALLAPVMLVIALLILLVDGAPVFYLSERMKTAQTPFCLWKFRTMRHIDADSGVSGAYKQDRITPLGHWLRRYRLDELPQLLNILRGDMSFVGPRPPLRAYVEMFPDLYARVLDHRPGVTGLATLVYHRTEARLLGDCHTRETSEDIYVRRCIPVKARLDLIWARHQSPGYDLALLCRTAFDVFAPRLPRDPGAELRRLPLQIRRRDRLFLARRSGSD
ncbi:Sugar transferase involved in LPS biosynthesis (colanic, teichoic acid) [Roseovarius azorensis]|uniref:Sugar transferase involved in LPS biosynthesis (Colanic, teichoic acid) n=1 Tax=Roseovarius azorensis TaxID=1287727 RepID=A0A1H7HA55_9RHOB|nr:Sugar transferase involved in LPS biosynthesis (colanic, teichoic acid) [Roseovarius azorensis]